MRHFCYAFTLIFGLSANLFADELTISVSHEFTDGKLYIKGTSNLPDSVKLGVAISNESGYSAQDFEIFTDEDGSFISTGFSNKGVPLVGNYTAEVVSYFNRAWNDDATISTLKTYSGNLIVDGEKIELTHDFSVVRLYQKVKRAMKLNAIVN
jgi:hypothetical protein